MSAFWVWEWQSYRKLLHLALIFIFLLYNWYFIITNSLLQCLGVAMIIYQISVYPFVVRACGPVGIARITGVSFHQIVAIIPFLRFQFLLFEQCPITLVPYADVINTSFAKLPFHSIVVRCCINHSHSYCFNSKEYSVCKCTSLFIELFNSDLSV